jgi:hypothetical protein
MTPARTNPRGSPSFRLLTQGRDSEMPRGGFSTCSLAHAHGKLANRITMLGPPTQLVGYGAMRRIHWQAAVICHGERSKPCYKAFSGLRGIR